MCGSEVGFLICTDDMCNICYFESIDSVDTQFVPSKRYKLETGRRIYKYSPKKRFFKCTICGHFSYISPDEIMGGITCKICDGEEVCECGKDKCPES